MRMRHRVLMDHCQDRLDHCRNQSMQSSLLPSRSLLNMLCMVWTRLGLRPASPGDTQYILLHQLYSHDRLGTAYSQLTGQSPGRLGLPRSWDIPSSLGLSETLRGTHCPRHRTVSLDPDRRHDIQMGSVCKRLPQRARNNPHRTANTVWKDPCRYLRNPQRTGGRIPVQMSYRCHWYRLRTLCWETSQYPLFRLRIQCMWWRLAARRCHFHKWHSLWRQTKVSAAQHYSQCSLWLSQRQSQHCTPQRRNQCSQRYRRFLSSHRTSQQCRRCS